MAATKGSRCSGYSFPHCSFPMPMNFRLKAPDVPSRHATYPTEYLYRHWQTLSDRVHPGCNLPTRQRAHEPRHQDSGTGKPIHNSIREAVRHLSLTKAGKIHRIPSHSFDNSPDRNDAGMYIANGSHSRDGFPQHLPTFSSHNA